MLDFSVIVGDKIEERSEPLANNTTLECDQLDQTKSDWMSRLNSSEICIVGYPETFVSQLDLPGRVWVECFINFSGLIKDADSVVKFRNVDVVTIDSNLHEIEHQINLLKTPKSELADPVKPGTAVQTEPVKVGTVKKLLSLDPSTGQVRR